MIAVPIPLETSIVFGPVQSRRLGRSLGINLLPLDRKVCPYDCVYCQYGRTTWKRIKPDARLFPSVDAVAAALEAALTAGAEPEALTFAGNGEPLLHPAFAEVVDVVRALRDRHAPRARLALLSNGALAYRPEIRAALTGLDLVMLKLDAGDPLSFRQINRPLAPLTLGRLIVAERGIPNLIIQSMFVDGAVSNAVGPTYEAYLNALDMIRPACVHVYSLDRPPAECDIMAVGRSRLEAIAADIRMRLDLAAEVY
jgi:wyosine [tRNA(Phe)-imidazoG37] synthetase (radical SAM superfamily)